MDKLAEIKVPTLIVWGSEDAISPLKNGHTLDRFIPDLELVVIQGAPIPVTWISRISGNGI